MEALNSVRFLHLSTTVQRNSPYSNPFSQAKAKTVTGREDGNSHSTRLLPLTHWHLSHNLFPLTTLGGMSVQHIQEERAQAVHACHRHTVFLGKRLLGMIVGLPHEQQVAPVPTTPPSVRLE